MGCSAILEDGTYCKSEGNWCLDFCDKHMNYCFNCDVSKFKDDNFTYNDCKKLIRTILKKYKTKAKEYLVDVIDYFTVLLYRFYTSELKNLKKWEQLYDLIYGKYLNENNDTLLECSDQILEYLEKNSEKNLCNLKIKMLFFISDDVLHYILAKDIYYKTIKDLKYRISVDFIYHRYFSMYITNKDDFNLNYNHNRYQKLPYTTNIQYLENKVKTLNYNDERNLILYNFIILEYNLLPENIIKSTYKNFEEFVDEIVDYINTKLKNLSIIRIYETLNQEKLIIKKFNKPIQILKKTASNFILPVVFKYILRDYMYADPNIYFEKDPNDFHIYTM